MTPQSFLYWIPLIVGLIAVFGAALPFYMDRLNRAHPAWMGLCIGAGFLVCIPIIQWLALAAILYMLVQLVRNRLS